MNNSYKWLHITYEGLDVLFDFDVIWNEPRGHAEKKKSNNLLQSKHAGLTSFRWPVVLIDHNFFLQLLYATDQGFSYEANEPILHRLVSHCYNSLLTFSVMQSR